MKYYISKSFRNLSFENAIDMVTLALEKEGFGVLTEIDIKSTLKKKLDIDFKPYYILGVCNPPFAYNALKSEDYIGLMLPCNIIIKQEDNYIDIAVIDPMASMQAVENEAVEMIAYEIRLKLERVMNYLVMNC